MQIRDAGTVQGDVAGLRGLKIPEVEEQHLPVQVPQQHGQEPHAMPL